MMKVLMDNFVKNRTYFIKVKLGKVGLKDSDNVEIHLLLQILVE